MLKLKRIYESTDSEDGLRILVDRLWPRGVKKEAAQLDYWLKEAAPSTPLRQWFHQGTGRFDAFRQKYLEELDSRPEAREDLLTLQELNHQSTVTLLYGAKDPVNNHAIVLMEWLEKQSR